jgi:hypothetical protein
VLSDRVGHANLPMVCDEAQTIAKHAYPHSSGIIAWYMSANKELGHDASDAGRSVA